MIRTKGNISLIALLCVFIVVLGLILVRAFLASSVQQNKSEAMPIPVAVGGTTDSVTEKFVAPKLPEKYNWKVQLVDDNYIASNEDNNLNVYITKGASDPRESYMRTYTPKGRLYSAKQSDAVKLIDGEDNLETFYASYIKDINSLGWQDRTVIYNDYIIQAIVADGAFGQISGYIKVSEDSTYASVIIMSKNLNAIVHEGPNGLESQCPCTYTVTVFVSDPILLADIITQSK